MDYFSFCLVELDLAAFLPFFKLLMFMLVALSVDADVSFEIICLLICFDKLHLVIVCPFIAPELLQKSRFVIGFIVDAGRKGQLLAAHTYSYRGERGNIGLVAHRHIFGFQIAVYLLALLLLLLSELLLSTPNHILCHCCSMTEVKCR